jgi:hypothetical protein
MFSLICGIQIDPIQIQAVLWKTGHTKRSHMQEREVKDRS